MKITENQRILRKHKYSLNPTESPKITKNITKSWKPNIRDCAGGAQKALKPFVNTIENGPGEAGAAPGYPGSIEMVECAKIHPEYMEMPKSHQKA